MAASHTPKRRRWASSVLVLGAAFFILLPDVPAAEVQPAPQAPSQSQEDSLKALEARAKRLAQQGLPQKTDEDRQKESKPIIPEDCTIEVVSWHPAAPQQTETAVYEIRGGMVTSRLPTLKEPEQKAETFRSEGYETTRTFEGTLQGNVIVGTWTYEQSEHQSWGWANTNPNRITSHRIVKTVDLIKVRLELHRDGTVTAETSGESIFKINRLIGDPPGVETIRKTWPDANTPAAWRAPGQGVWQFRTRSATAATAESKPAQPPQEPRASEPRISVKEPPTKFRLPPEQPPTKPEPPSPGRRSPTDEEPLEEMPPWAKRKFDALPQERKNLFRKYYFGYGLDGKRSGQLLDWLSDAKLPLKELEVRAQLLLTADHRYQQFYKTVASTAVDNVADGQVWKRAAKLTPAVKYGELVTDLATMPYELAILSAEYREAADADRVLEKFVASYGKSEADIAHDLATTKHVIKWWNMRYQQAEADYQKARAETPSAVEGLASDPHVRQRQREADQKMIEAAQTMRQINKEQKELDLEFKALTLRLKTIRCDWKSWIVHWEK